MREARKELEGSLAPRLEQRDKAVDQLEGERGEEEKQVEEWVDHPGGQVASEVNTPTCHNLTKVAAVVRRGSTVQITRQIRFCNVTWRLASSSACGTGQAQNQSHIQNQIQKQNYSMGLLTNVDNNRKQLKVVQGKLGPGKSGP